MIAQLNKKHKVVISDGSNPIGIIDDLRTNTENTITNRLICVWTTGGVYATDQIEKKCDFLRERLLYVSTRGKLTTRRRNKSHRPIGTVVSYLGGLLEFEFWG
jgi:hypothetical protein